MAAIILFRSCPALADERAALHILVVARPSPMNMSFACGSPSPKTTLCRVSASGQRRQPSAIGRSSSSDPDIERHRSRSDLDLPAAPRVRMRNRARRSGKRRARRVRNRRRARNLPGGGRLRPGRRRQRTRSTAHERPQHFGVDALPRMLLPFLPDACDQTVKKTPAPYFRSEPCC